MAPTVRMTCMTKKTGFDAEPEVVLLKNGRYAYRAECPWEGPNGKPLVAFKFAPKQAYLDYMQNQEPKEVDTSG